jgi:hypothetical protein
MIKWSRGLEMAFRLRLPNQVFGFVFGIIKHGMEAAGISLLNDHSVHISLNRQSTQFLPRGN